jgi:hypothetical protein
MLIAATVFIDSDTIVKGRRLTSYSYYYCILSAKMLQDSKEKVEEIERILDEDDIDLWALREMVRLRVTGIVLYCTVLYSTNNGNTCYA